MSFDYGKLRQAGGIHGIVKEKCLRHTWCSELLLDDRQQTLTGREARLWPGQETMEQLQGLLQNSYICSHMRCLKVQ